ncbi:hypothetical protein [Serratia fonticola]
MLTTGFNSTGREDQQMEAMANEARFNAKIDTLRHVLSEVASSSSKEMMEKIADDINAAFDKLYLHKHEGSIEPTRGQMIEYIKIAIGEGYQPEHEAAISDLGVIELLDDHSLNREYGKCWQWYNMGGGIHETFQKQEKHDHACTNCFADQGPCLGKCAVSDENAQRRNSFVEAATPLIKWMAENVNPHHTAVVDSTSAELLSSEMAVKTEAHLKD